MFERHTPNGEVQYRDVVIGEDRSADKTMTPGRSFTTPRLLSREKTRRARVLGLVLRETGGGEATLEPVKFYPLIPLPGFQTAVVLVTPT